jgi:hypothetical protein
MATMRAEIVMDLQRKGYTPIVSTQLVSFDEFKRAFAPGAGGSAGAAAGSRLGPLSATDQQRDEEAEEKARKEVEVSSVRQRCTPRGTGLSPGKGKQ